METEAKDATSKKKRGSSIYLGGDNIYPDNADFHHRHSEVKVSESNRLALHRATTKGCESNSCCSEEAASLEEKLHLLILGIENMANSKDQGRVEEILRSNTAVKEVVGNFSTRAVRVVYYASQQISSCNLREALAEENFLACILMDNLMDSSSDVEHLSAQNSSIPGSRTSTQRRDGCGSRHSVRKRLTLGVSNMNDTSDQTQVEKAILGLAGVTSVKTALSNASIVIDYNG
jgi:hypothetical protein